MFHQCRLSRLTSDSYGWSDQDPLAFPYHLLCRTLLERYLSPDRPLSDDVLYEVLEACFGADDEYNRCLDINYAGAEEQHYEGWFPCWDYEHTVCNPINDPWLERYYENLPPLEPGSEGSVVEDQGWDTKVRAEQPWLYDLPETTTRANRPVDWQHVYQDLKEAGNSDDIGLGTCLGLANRQRLWAKVFEQFKDPYLDAVRREKERRSSLPAALDNAECTSAKQLILPAHRHGEHAIVSLVSDLSHLPFARAGLRIYSAGDGTPIGIGALPIDGKEPDVDACVLEREPVTEDVHFEADDWLTGFVFTVGTSTAPNQQSLLGISVLLARGEVRHFGSLEGSKSIIHVGPETFIAGLLVRYDPCSESLSSLSLIEQPLTKAPSQASRVIVHRDSSYTINSGRIGSYVWARELPPPNVSAQCHRCGYSSRVDDPAGVAVEALVFGATDAELADVVALSADVQMGAFAVRYASRPARSVGPRMRAVKTLRIDGTGGERIVSVHSAVDSDIRSIRFVTNRRRQLVVFNGKPDRETTWPSRCGEAAPDDGAAPVALAGVYFWWDSGACRVCASHPPELSLVGGLVVPAAESVSAGPLHVSDGASEMKWEPEVPSALDHHPGVLDGKIWGSITPVADGGAISTYLDCTRPLSKVRMTLCHETLDGAVPLVALRFTYADGEDEEEEMSAGPDEFPLDPDPEDWCCLVWNRGMLERQADDAGPHYRHETWDVGGERLGLLRIWTARRRASGGDGGGDAEATVLAAVQMVTKGGLESPVWGYGGRANEGAGEELSEVRFRDEGMASGLVCHMSDVARNHGRDSLIRAVQVLASTG